MSTQQGFAGQRCQGFGLAVLPWTHPSRSEVAQAARGSLDIRQEGHHLVATHYEILKVAETAEQAEVRRAYHRAARRWHPDRFVDADADEAAKAENAMRRVNQAWEVLGQPVKREQYDRALRTGAHTVAGSGPRPGVTNDDGVIRIDPRLLDPEFLAARRQGYEREVSYRTSLILRVAPLAALVLLLAAIFVFSAYARDNEAVAAPSTVPGPSLGTGIEANDCVSVLQGPALLARPCDAGADGRVIGARQLDGVCPLGTTREVELTNGAVACLAALR